MRHHTTFTRSFVFILVITLIAAYGALLMARHQKNNIPNYQTRNDVMTIKTGQEDNAYTTLTSGWKEYADKTYPLKFKYPPAWKVETNNSTPGYYTVKLMPGGERAVNIYISRQDYFGMTGLETEKYDLNGKHGQIIGDWVYGFKEGEYYYTFDSTDTATPPTELSSIVATATLK